MAFSNGMMEAAVVPRAQRAASFQHPLTQVIQPEAAAPLMLDLVNVSR